MTVAFGSNLKIIEIRSTLHITIFLAPYKGRKNWFKCLFLFSGKALEVSFSSGSSFALIIVELIIYIREKTLADIIFRTSRQTKRVNAEIPSKSTSLWIIKLRRLQFSVAGCTLPKTKEVEIGEWEMKRYFEFLQSLFKVILERHNFMGAMWRKMMWFHDTQMPKK